jgi:hypothetical protein
VGHHHFVRFADPDGTQIDPDQLTVIEQGMEQGHYFPDAQTWGEDAEESFETRTALGYKVERRSLRLIGKDQADRADREKREKRKA